VRIRSAQAWSDEDIPELLEALDEALNTSVAAMSSFEKYRAEVLSGALDWTPMHTNPQFWAVCAALLRWPALHTLCFIRWPRCVRAQHPAACHRMRAAARVPQHVCCRMCAAACGKHSVACMPWQACCGMHAAASMLSHVCCRANAVARCGTAQQMSGVRGVQENAVAMEETDRQIIRCLIKLLETSRDPKVLAVACHDLGSFAHAHPIGRYIINDLGGKPFVMSQMASPHAEVQKHALVCVQRLMLGKDKLDFLSRPGANAGASSSGAVAT
jgi:V-ATPase subunit H